MNRLGQTLEPVVLLVDSKTRDLDVATLIALQLHELGVECHLEPLEAYRAVLGAYRPGMVIFNHLNASHLVAWSKRLADVGVLTAVLPNEGIAYDGDDLRFLAGVHHRDAHIDFIFSWNEPYRQAVLAALPNQSAQIEVVGVPRFDFYFEPWARIVERPPVASPARPRILLCTNFVTAHYWELPRQDGDKFFAPWAGRIPIYNDYWCSIEAHWKARTRALDYLDALLAADKYDVILRPHPRENVSFYTDWVAKLPAERRRHLQVDPLSPISSLILDCDLEISCETCTTAIESWIARKPTVELIFERDPLWYREEHARCNVECDDPTKLADIVKNQLRDLEQSEKRELRRQHLEKWCATPDGTSSRRLARTVAGALRGKKAADWSKLTANDYRRAAKLNALSKLGVAYHFDPLLPIKRALFGKRYGVRDYAYRKSIKPRDVLDSRQRLERAFGTKQ